MQKPKGKLIAIGGAEDKGTEFEKGEIHKNNLNFFELGILRRIVEEAGGVKKRIEVVTTASMIPHQVGENYLNAFGKIGCVNVGIMHIRTRENLQQTEYIKRLSECDCVMITGGNQMRLTATLGGTEFLKVLRRRYQTEKIVVAGTSAGAMAMSASTTRMTCSKSPSGSRAWPRITTRPAGRTSSTSATANSHLNLATTTSKSQSRPTISWPAPACCKIRKRY